MKRLNLHLYQSAFTNETRILRITKSLSERDWFDEIHVLALHEKGQPRIEWLDKKRKVIRIRNFFHTLDSSSKIRYLALIEWNLRIFFRYLFSNVRVVNPHSVPALPIALLLHKLKGSILIYDTHEIETEQYAVNGPTKKISKIIERISIPSVNHIFVTSDGYGNWYKKNYGIHNITVVKNFPYKRDLEENHGNLIRSKFNISNDSLLFIYQGLIAYGRGLELLLEVFKKCQHDRHIVFMGFGPQVNVVKEAAALNSNIHFMDAVSPSDVYKYVSGVDIGLCLIEGIFTSYTYTLPNKLLEALNVGVPVIVSDFPDMAKVVNDYDCGWAIEVGITPLENLIVNLTKGDIEKKRVNAKRWANENTWNSEANKMLAVYENLETFEK